MSTSLVRLKSLRVHGFRSFGQEPQALLIDSDIAVVWGPNSQGKTSLAEAIEFLLTGKIVRREMLASAQDEFADSLRNAHLPDATPVVISADVLDGAGQPRSITRTLTQDYQRRQDCSSQLHIDGVPAVQADLDALGLGLSQPPLSAPILTQHTLAYLFSARPQDRANYFKSVLEVTDLEDFRTAVSGLSATIGAPNATLDLFNTCSNTPDFQSLRAMLDSPATLAPVRLAFMTAAATILTESGVDVPEELPDRLEALGRLRESKEHQSFPIEGFGVSAPAAWAVPAASLWGDLRAYQAELARVGEETRRMTELFRCVLALPMVESSSTAVDCPVCGTDDALTPERIQLIRSRVADTDAFRLAESKGKAALRALAQSAATLTQAATAVLPQAIKRGSAWRHTKAFRVLQLRTLLGTGDSQLVDSWMSSISRLIRSSRELTRRAARMEAMLEQLSQDPTQPFADLQSAFDGVAPLRDALAEASRLASAAETPLVTQLRMVISEASETVGWEEFERLGTDPSAVVVAINDHRARESLSAELARALREIERAKEEVLDERFAELSGSIGRWWNLLRPGEPTFFEALQQRPGARRTIDFKAGLSPNEDRSSPRVRDVIAVFSQSQLHCLGLALFLARAEHEGCGFVVLDDPILASDDEHRAHFVCTVVEELATSPRQVIVLTQCRTTWRDLGDRYAHRDINLFQIELSDPAAGSLVTKSSDDVKSRLNAVKPLLRNNNPDIRKIAAKNLRDIAERFCKELIVKGKRAAGDATAVISDYDNKTLGELEPLVQPYFTDPSHPGKLRVIRNGLNPGGHDGAVPDSGTLVTCSGDLKRFADDYL